MNVGLFIIGGKGLRTVPERMIVIFLAFSIAFFPLLPLAAIADEPTGESVTEESETTEEKEAGADESETGSEDGDGKEDAKPEGSIVGPLSFPEEEEEEEEPEADIVNGNDAVLENDVSAESDTGGNVIGETEEACDEDGEAACPAEDSGMSGEAVADENSGSDGSDEGVSEGTGDDISGSEAAPGGDTCGTEDGAPEAEEACSGPETEGSDGASENDMDTGDATADATLVTDVNVNIVGEDIVKDVVEFSGHTEGDVNLLGHFLALEDATEEEEEDEAEEGRDDGEEARPEEGEGESDGLSVVNTNTAEISNTVSADADTGANTVTGAKGDAAIDTGDALAMAALVNLVNINLVGENGLFSVINNFGEWIGDIVLPGDGLLSVPGSASTLRTTENSNVLELTETVSASASTGGNTVEGTGGAATIDTGDALAFARSETLTNMNFVGNAWVYFLFNNFGVWVGQVIDGDEVVGDSYSYALGDDTETDDAEEDGNGECTEPDCTDIVAVSNVNTAVIRNTVVADASTGGNAITDAEGAASIATGGATAVAGVFNLANVNIVGSDWLFGVFNNFGTWRGNLVFAYPDLAVSIDDGADEANPGDGMAYRVTVENVGKAEAEEIRFSLDLPDGFLPDGTVPEIPERLAAGDGFSFEVSGTVAPGMVGTTLFATAAASTGTTEKHGENNADTDETDIVLPASSITRVSDDSDDDDEGEFSIRRETFGADSVAPGGAVGCRITLMNDGDVPLYGVEVVDTFAAPDGFEFDSYLWDVGFLAPDEGVIIEYAFQAGVSSSPGRYLATARATGREGDDDKVKSRKAYAAFTVIPAAYAETITEEDDFPEIVETAEAVPETLGVSEVAKREFPIIFLILSGIAYALLMNWSWVPKLRYETYGKE